MRARPLTLQASGAVRSKAAVPLLGRPLIDWQVRVLREQGVGEFCVVAKGRENRLQIKEILRYGEEHDVRVRYSRPRYDRDNVGSGESTLRNLELWDLHGMALVFPTDSVFELDLAAMADAHRRSGAMLTVGSVTCDAEVVAGKYGVVVSDGDGWATRFLEKPSLHHLRAVTGGGPVSTNAGLYLLDVDRFRSVYAAGSLIGMLASRLDWGRDLLPWLIARGAPVLDWPIDRLGDLGTPADYLCTVRSILAGDYPDITKMLPSPVEDQVWIHESSLLHRDPLTGQTLAERIRAGSVRIGPGVRVGRDVEIGAGVSITASDVADGVDLREGCELDGVTCLDGTMIGPHARLRDTYLGAMTIVDSTASRPVRCDGYAAIGDGVTIGRGARLAGAIVESGEGGPVRN